jgi:hypothetical protein
MAVTSRSTTASANTEQAGTTKTDAPAPAAPGTDAPERHRDAGWNEKVARRECVVDDGTAHMGRATPGAVICSAHAMHYNADGTSRA